MATTPKSNPNSEQAPLLPIAKESSEYDAPSPAKAPRKRIIASYTIFWVFIVSCMAYDIYSRVTGWKSPALPKDPQQAVKAILKRHPVIDGHIDLPIFVRGVYKNNGSAFDLNGSLPQHVDIPRLREGQVGGFFWSAYVSCADWMGLDEGEDFLNSTWRVRDTLEQVDISRVLISKYSNTFELASTSRDVKRAIHKGKIASMIGVEGAHQLGNSIAVARQLYLLGVRYITLTHTCHNAFADSVAPEKPKWGGLSPLGKSLIDEMNRLGMLVDLSHVADDTARQGIKHSKAPVIWSHSSARAIHDHPRNVPDDVLELIGEEEGKNDAVVMVNFAPDFVSEPDRTATVAIVADHVEHIAKVAGKRHVGLGSDFDGIGSVPVGLEDVSKYPALILELYKRGWTESEIAGLTNQNLLRVMAGAERVAKELQQGGMEPIYDVYEKRTDL